MYIYIQYTYPSDMISQGSIPAAPTNAGRNFAA